MDIPPPPHRPVRRDTLTRALVDHVRARFAEYAEVELTGDTTEPAGNGRTDRTGPPLLVDVRDAHDAGPGPGQVLVLCECTDLDPEDAAAPGDPRGAVPRTAAGRAVDVVQVRRASEIAGAVAESTAGDLPLVVDVRLSWADAEALLTPAAHSSPHPHASAHAARHPSSHTRAALRKALSAGGWAWTR